MATLSTVNVKITGDTGQLVSSLTVAEKRVTAFSSHITGLGNAATTQARGFSNLARGFTNAAGQSGVLNSEISILASSVGNIGLLAAGAGIGFGALVGGFGASIASAISFETQITRVAKTANLSAAETKVFGDEILSMSRRLPIATNELTAIAEVAGQLGISGAGNLATFTEEIAKLSTTTGIAGQELASSLGLITQVFNLPIENVKNLSAEITDLGNTMNSTEGEILGVASRVAGVGAALGVPIADILSLSSLAASVTGDVEATGSALQRTFLSIHEVSSIGGDAEKLQVFADVARLTTEEFTNLAKTDPGVAFAKFVEGLRGVENVEQVLKALDLNDVRITKTLLAIAQSTDTASEAINNGRRAAEEATATDAEFGRQAETTAAKLQILKNNIGASAVEIGTVFLPAVNLALDGLIRFSSQDVGNGFENIKNNLFGLLDAVEGIGPAAFDAYASIANIENTKENLEPVVAAFDAITSAVGRLISAINDIPGLPDFGGFLKDFAVASAGFAVAGPFGLAAPFIGKDLFGKSGDDERNRALGDRTDATDLLGINKGINLRNAQDAAAAEKKRVVGTPDTGPKGPHQLTALEAAMDGVITRTEALTLGLTDQEVILLESAVAANKVADAEFRNRIGLEALAQAYPGLTGEQVKFQLGLQAIAEHLAATGESIQKFILDTSTSALQGFQSAFDAIFNKPTKEDAALQKQLHEAQRRKLLAGSGASESQTKNFDAAIKRIQDLIAIRSNARDLKKDDALLADKSIQSDRDQATAADLYITAIGDASQKVLDNTGIVYLQTLAGIGLKNTTLDTTTEIAKLGDAAATATAKMGGGVSSAAPAVGSDWQQAFDILHNAGIPGYASGIANVPRDMVARIHKGERIIPAGGESGQTINFTTHITADSNASDESMRKLAKMVREETETAMRRASFRGSYVTSGAYTPS